QKKFDAIILDPPTFSSSKKSGIFRVEKDYPRLLKAALSLLTESGVVLACCNKEGLAPEKFIKIIHMAIKKTGYRILDEKFFGQPPDFPTSSQEPGYLKCLWMKLEKAPPRPPAFL